MKPTNQQQAFIDALLNTAANLALVARAGCGKTSTILMGVAAQYAQNPRLEVLICAFNKAIEVEMSEKLKKAGYDWKQVQAKTIHSLGFGLLRFLFKPEIDEKKVRKLVQAQNDDACQIYPQQVEQLVHYAKQAGFGFFPDQQIGDARAWYELADHYDVNGLDDTSEADSVVEAAQKVYRLSLAKTDTVDFDDMVLFPLVKNLRVKFAKDLVFVDEAQDLSPARQALIRKFVKPGSGRMVIVGDDRQAIYGFSGADSDALPNMIRQLRATVLPLSVTWRCPKAVVALAQTKVPDIEAAPEAPEGLVTKVTTKEDLDLLLAGLGPTDAILCRNTAPLVETAYKLIRAGKPCKVEGRAIGEGLINLARRWKVKTVDSLMNRLGVYQEREVQKALAKGNESKAEEVADRVGTLIEICMACVSQGKTAVQDVVDFIDNLFADGATNVTILATYHRSKGREWPRVILWQHAARCPSRAAKQDWQLAQEENLAYVAFTRAQEQVVFVS